MEGKSGPEPAFGCVALSRVTQHSEKQRLYFCQGRAHQAPAYTAFLCVVGKDPKDVFVLVAPWAAPLRQPPRGPAPVPGPRGARGCEHTARVSRNSPFLQPAVQWP